MTAPQHRLVEAGPAHAAVLAVLHAQAFPADEAWSAAVLTGQLMQPGCFALLAMPGPDTPPLVPPGPAGMLMARVVAGEAEILTLAVIPAARRRGLAAALLAAALRRAGQAGAQAMFLEVSAANAPAQALYAASGFQPVGRRRRYYPNGADALVLRADLTRRAAAAAC